MTTAHVHYVSCFDSDLSVLVNRAIGRHDHRDITVQYLTTVVPGEPLRRGSAEVGPPRLLREAYITYTGGGRF